ncbi:MAG: carbon-nitrogen hydrolase family protein [Candidatus Bathyarchaeia archaeon]
MVCNIGVAQMNSVPGEVEVNLNKVAQLMYAAHKLGANLIVFPETFSTGFNIGEKLSHLAENIPGKTTDFIGKLTQKYNMYFYGSLIEKANGRLFNTGVFIGPTGDVIAVYRKVHLFSSEKLWFTPGCEPSIVQTPFGVFALTICMDLLFPEYIRGLVLMGAECILNTTNWLWWPELNRWNWSHVQPRALAVTRALENTVGLAMASQWGREGEYFKLGHSCIVSPSGSILGGIEDGEGLAVQLLSLENVEEWRQIATYLADRKEKTFLYRRMLNL